MSSNEMSDIDERLMPPEKLQIMRFTPTNFVRIGDNHVRHFQNKLGLTPDADVLEIGSGNGRISQAFTRFLSPSGSYTGVDVMKDFTDWCADAYADYPNFLFEHVDVENTYYYEDEGAGDAADYRFRFDDESFDFVFMTSVCTHLDPAMVQNYLRESHRMLRPGGTLFTTFFLIDDGTLESIAAGKARRTFVATEQSGFYVINPKNPLAATGFDLDLALGYFGEADLAVTEGYPQLGRWRDSSDESSANHNQDRIAATKP